MRLPHLILPAAGGALILAGVAFGASSVHPRPVVVKVNHVRVYLDTNGSGKGELLFRVFSDYGRQGLKGKWWGATEVSVRGPGGVINLADIRRLHHPESGERVDHRMLLRPTAARHLLGRAGIHAKLQLTASAYLLPIQAPGSAARAACCNIQYSVHINPVGDFPGEQRTFGDGVLTVDWSEMPPYQAYASRFVVRNTDEIDNAEGSIGSGGSFSATGSDGCGDPAGFLGTVTPPNKDGTFPANAVARASWNIPQNSLGGCGSSGSYQGLSIDP
jgi:hypothetical protein